MSAKLRGRAFLVVAVLAGLAAALLTRELVRRAGGAPPPPAPVVDTQPVLVASTDLSAGAAIGPGQVELVPWPTELLPVGYVAEEQSVSGRVLQRSIRKAEPIYESALAPVGQQAGLGALIESDRRAMAVKVDPVVIVAGFVKPGSSVDVIATLRTERAELPFTGVILQDLKVLAIDQKLEQGEGAEAELASVVTLEVTPEEAQKLAYAAKEGALQLALRNPLDEKKSELPGITGKDVIPEPGARPGRDGSIEVIRGLVVEPQRL